MKLRNNAITVRAGRAVLGLSLMLFGLVAGARSKQPQEKPIEDVTGNYEFLSPDDTLAILEEEGKLKGYVDVYQGEEESDAILSYPLTIGTRSGDHVEFKTRRIHERYFRFSGTVERGKGRSAREPDYLRLVGELQIIQSNSVTGQESVDRRNVIFKSKGSQPEEQ